MTFRPAVLADIPLLTELRATFHAFEPFPRPLPEAQQTALLEHVLTTSAAGRAWLLEVDGAVAGYLVLTFGFSLEYGGTTALLDELFLLDTFRGRGLGAEALAFVADFCQKAGFTVVQLEVDCGNLAAQRLYERAGFAGLDKRALLTRWLS